MLWRRLLSDDDGYTLIEVLVALAILSLSAATLFAIFGQSIARTEETEKEMAARTLAQSLLAQANAYQPLPFGKQGGLAPGDLSWQLIVKPFDQHDDKIAPVHAAIVTATVTWRRNDGDRSLTLSTLQVHPGTPAQ